MIIIHKRAHLQDGAQDVRERALDKELVAVQHKLHFAVVPSGLPDEDLDLIWQLHLAWHSISISTLHKSCQKHTEEHLSGHSGCKDTRDSIMQELHV